MAVEKIEMIKEAIKARESAVIAFSGGVDSATLAALAFEALGEKALAVTIDSPLFPRQQLETAVQTACEIGIQHKVLPFSQMSLPYFSANPVNRCYFCKKALLETLLDFAEKMGYNVVLEGTNFSEIQGENRPGYQGSTGSRRKGLFSFRGIECDKRGNQENCFGVFLFQRPTGLLRPALQHVFLTGSQ